MADTDINSPLTDLVLSKNNFEEMYIAVRRKENRVYSDSQVALLPGIDPSHPHAKEWKIRRRSAERLFKYLEQKRRPLSIAEIGCGNGWLIAKLATLENVVATGIDINTVELEQAGRVFGLHNNLSFSSVNIEQEGLQRNKFDIIIFAASLQYFPSTDSIIQLCLSALKPGGEIHILDSHFYTDTEIEQAKMRTAQYYRSLGFEEMAEQYYHCETGSLQKYSADFLYNPSTLMNRLFRKPDCFPWIRIEKKA